ncbi:uncharacterized protein N7469_000868 [Penicillium citrinum]|uniref:Uncharacterized protein n=2 Tax=Penicillium TaxID=5073 RepID=A0A9W9PDP3_PENCI|nr:uncharacterized protein N7469_000868 [Penicillium citrinum]KAJ5242541.1 hypothetical protein N7469_000868 [Penicillium citrinum]KAJ5599956.1 hypothetical protein N7450_001023 [Penicillium hetheringtonii]
MFRIVVEGVKVNREEGTSNAVDELKDFAQLDISPIKYLESPGRGKKKHEVQAQEMQQDSKGKKAVNPSSSQAPCQSNDMRAISSRNQANTAETLDAQAPQTEINTQVEPVRTSAPYSGELKVFGIVVNVPLGLTTLISTTAALLAENTDALTVSKKRVGANL